MRALIIVDVQKDFLPGGALAVPDGNQVIPVINRLQEECDCVIASKDWHPENHVSFQQWPPHCVQKSEGAEFPDELIQTRIEKVFLKGEDLHQDSYSAFAQMDPYLRKRGVDEIWVVGLALDYCVETTAIEAAKRGWKVSVILDGCRAINEAKLSVARLEQAGVFVL